MAGAARPPERAAGAGFEPRSAKLCDRPSLWQPAAPEPEHRAGGHDALLLVARGSRKIPRGRIAARRGILTDLKELRVALIATARPPQFMFSPRTDLTLALCEAFDRTARQR